MMDFSKKEQIQTAGDKAIQTQMSDFNNCNVTINSSELIRSIATEVCSKELLNIYRTCTHDALEIARIRDQMFAQTFIPRLEKIESAMDALRDPSFQYMIQEARETAAKTDKCSNLELLSELLICHIEKGKNKKVDSGINRAIKIVDEGDIDSLCALTVICALHNIAPLTGNIQKGFSILDQLYGSILDTELPKENDWIDQLNVLGAINILPGRFLKLDEFLGDVYDGYFCVGIKQDSAEHKESLKILADNDDEELLLVENELIDGYLRLNVVQLCSLDEKYKPIINLYTKDSHLMKEAKTNCMKIWDSYKNLNTIRTWFESIKIWFRINSVGKALAQTNAKRCYKDFPDIIK